MPLKLNSTGGGSVTLDTPSTASNFTVTMPSNTQTLGIQSATAQASTSGTSIDFTGIPSWVKRITVMFSGVSTNGTSPLIIQIGSGSIDATSTYVGAVTALGTNVTTAFTTSYIVANAPFAAYSYSGSAIFSLVGSNIWVNQCVLGRSDGATCLSGGTKTLSGALDRVRITTVNGTDTFDAGSINILYEG